MLHKVYESSGLKFCSTLNKPFIITGFSCDGCMWCLSVAQQANKAFNHPAVCAPRHTCQHVSFHPERMAFECFPAREERGRGGGGGGGCGGLRITRAYAKWMCMGPARW